MSQRVKTKRQANFKDFKRFGAFKRGASNKNFCIYSTRSCVNWALFGTRVLNWPTLAKKAQFTHELVK
jgi:hypothetical protein